MAEDRASQETEDSLGKEFDEIVERTEETGVDQSTDQPEAVTAADDDAVTVPVRRDHDGLPAPEVPEVAEVTEPEKESVVTEETAVPAPVAVPPVAAAPRETPTHGTGASLVLQWLSYAFWGWFGVAITWLAGVTFAYFVTGNSTDVTAALAYPLASVIVMCIVALCADLFYSRREPAIKRGGANAIMLVHVVLFVLIGVAAAVTALFSLISALLSTDLTTGTDGQMIACLTSLVTVLVFGLVSLRMLAGGKKPVLRVVHWVVMSLLAASFIVLSIVGPAMGAQATRGDRLIEEGLPTLNNAIQEYVGEHSKLPEKLSDVETGNVYLSTAADALLSRNLVRYTANVKEASRTSSTYNDYVTTTYYYRMCVTYTHTKKGTGTYEGVSLSSTRDSYQTYLYITSHEKGEVCYDLKASDSYGIVYPMDDAEESAVEGSTSSGTTNSR